VAGRCTRELQHAPIGDPLAEQLLKDLRVERVEEAADVAVNHPASAPHHLTLDLIKREVG
jgi:hypothetical protein